MAAIINRTSSSHILRSLSGTSEPAANNRESPGRKGVTTKPVSIKIIRKRMAYVHTPYWLMMFARCSSRCKKRSIKNLICSMNNSQFTAYWIHHVDIKTVFRKIGADYTVLLYCLDSAKPIANDQHRNTSNGGKTQV